MTMEQLILPGMERYFMPEHEHRLYRSILDGLDLTMDSLEAGISDLREAERLLLGGPSYEQLSFDFAQERIVYVIGIVVERANDPVSKLPQSLVDRLYDN